MGNTIIKVIQLQLIYTLLCTNVIAQEIELITHIDLVIHNHKLHT